MEELGAEEERCEGLPLDRTLLAAPGFPAYNEDSRHGQELMRLHPKEGIIAERGRIHSSSEVWFPVG